MSYKCSNTLKKYVPRHLRLGLSCSHPDLICHQDIVEDVPVVTQDGSVVSTHHVVKSVPCSKSMAKYKLSAFRLSALIKNGVPLSVVNVNSSNSVTIDKLERICKNIDSADSYVQKCLEQQRERESWFKEPGEESVVSTNTEQ